jgi:hypothetical protein
MADFNKHAGSVSYTRPTAPEEQRFSFVDGAGVQHRLRLDRQSEAIVLLYYVNDLAENVPFPNGFTVEEFEPQIMLPNAPAQQFVARNALYLGNAFVFVWENNYTVRYNGRPVIRLNKQKQQSIIRGRDISQAFEAVQVVVVPLKEYTDNLLHKTDIL